MIETLAKATMFGLLVAAAPIQAGTGEPSLWAQWGLAGVVVAYVLWRDAQREKRMGAAIDGQQKWIRETLVDALARNATAMERMAAWMEQLEDAHLAATRHVRAREDGDGHHR